MARSFLLLLLYPFLVLYNAFSWGYVASVLYTWFVVSVFPEIIVFKWWEFAGFMFFITCFTYKSNSSKVSVVSFSNSILNPWILLLSAWIFTFIY
jgi:hypothetical protein